MNQNSTTLADLMKTDFPENKQVRRLEKPNVIRFTLPDFQCDIHLSEIQTEADLLTWAYWLTGKQAVTVPILVRFLQLAAKAMGFFLHGDIEELSPLDIWFTDHPELTVKQFADLEGFSERQAREKLIKLVKKRELRVSRTEGRQKFYSQRRGIPALNQKEI